MKKLISILFLFAALRMSAQEIKVIDKDTMTVMTPEQTRVIGKMLVERRYLIETNLLKDSIIKADSTRLVLKDNLLKTNQDIFNIALEEEKKKTRKKVFWSTGAGAIVGVIIGFLLGK